MAPAGRGTSDFKVVRIPRLLGPGLLLVVQAAHAQPRFGEPSRGVVPTAPEPPAAPSIPAPEVARRAEEAARLLRELDAQLVPGPGIVAIQKRLPAVGRRVAEQVEETTARLDQQRPHSTA